MVDKIFKSPRCIVSRRLRERKENVAEHLKTVGECVSSLHAVGGRINSKFGEECQRIENEINIVIETLTRRKLAVLQELEAEKDNKLKGITSSLQFANETMLKTEEVSTNVCRYKSCIGAGAAAA